jgi:hypothetical protein
MFGTLSNITTKPTPTTRVKLMDTPLLVHKIKTGYYQLYGVAIQDRNGIWVVGNAQQIKLFDVNDKSMKKSMNTALSGEKHTAVTNQGHIIYARKEGRTIYMYIVKYELSEELISVQGWRIHGLCVTSADGLLVVLTSDNKKETKVVRYHGCDEKQTIQFESGGKPLYSVGGNQKCICENKNFDVCVADRDACAVVVVSQNGKLRFRYEENPSSRLRSGFKPKGIATDSLGDILVADLDNACVHIIDENGKFLKIIDCPNVQPWGLCVGSDDYLYVADNAATDVIKIQYLQ